MYCSKLFCVIVVLLGYFSVATVDAINCYQCNSHLDPECADLRAHPPHKVAGFHQPCDDTDAEGNPAFCRTMTYKFKFLKKTDLDASRVVRTCGYRRSMKECYIVDNDHHMESVCQCFEDGCNTAQNLSIFSIISTLVIASTLHFIF
ncbi:uncharacterized protein LOC129573249 [Sitodiplosis mosellana]|uniref:uncharacterized protein LOC129573249 n=1 Tax=Sitodiplosis mosellana TaxID=263140 RepID=UPI00244478D9|nr:uncharacterized protein LOC129573249 [Sitodiplosis mosellana]